MKDYVIYYLTEKTLSEEHKRHISEGMKRWYASTGGMRKEHRKHISDGMKRTWRIWKQYWADAGDGGGGGIR